MESCPEVLQFCSRAECRGMIDNLARRREKTENKAVK